MAKTFEFEMSNVYRTEVEILLSSRKKSKVIHASGNIDASGDEIEEPFRDFLRRRLPSKYFVGHGHIVDKNLQLSPQLDVIIADNNATPILFEAENGAQYFPWESVYAIGEIKSTYAKSRKYVSAFSDMSEALLSKLKRDTTPSNYLSDDISLGPGLQLGDNRKYRNPLLSFMVFFDSGDATKESLMQEYQTVSRTKVPLSTVFLDGSIVVKASLSKKDEGICMDTVELDPIKMVENDSFYWMWSTFTMGENSGGHALSYFMLTLFNHLNSCILMRPKIGEYLKHVYGNATQSNQIISVRAALQIIELEGGKVPKILSDFLKDREFRGLGIEDLTDEEINDYCIRNGIDRDAMNKEMESGLIEADEFSGSEGSGEKSE